MFRVWSGLVAVVVWWCAARGEEAALELLTSRPTRCTYDHAYDMFGAHCASLRLDHIPKLKTSIEILDFSDNKLRELQPETFAEYTSIKFLYLSENQIYFIHEDAFAPLSSLQTIDLSKNVITEIPTTIFHLRYLRKLYLNGNPLIRLDTSAFRVNQLIVAPLELLDLADCKIRNLPEWGILPQLTLYNISHNPLIGLDRDHFAGMCNLKKVDITSSIDKINVCKLKSTIMWFQDKQIYFMLGNYSKLNSKDFDNCEVNDISPELNVTYQKCKSEFVQVPQVRRVRASRRTWLSIGGGLAAFLVGFILLLYLMHRRNVAVSKATEKQSRPADVAGKRKLLEYES